MRVVFDTNVVISGMLWSGAPSQALALARSHRVTALTTESLVDELRDVLNRSKFSRFLLRLNSTSEHLIAEYLTYTTVVEPIPISHNSVRDIKDVKVLEAGRGGQVQFIVSGDDDLISLKIFEAIKILTVSEFIDNVKTNDISE